MSMSGVVTASAQSYRVVLKYIEPTRNDGQTTVILGSLCKAKANYEIWVFGFNLELTKI